MTARSRDRWYARTTWSDADRDDFLARLGEVVGEHERAATVRKQAAHLLAFAKGETRAGRAATPEERAEALAGASELYERFLATWPASSDLAYVHAALGETRELAGDDAAALEHWRRALAAQRSTTRSTNAHLRFGMLVVRRAQQDLYDEALTLITAHGQVLVYPRDQYEQCGIRAWILAMRGERERARLCALDALAATKHCAFDPDSPFHIGLVELVRPPMAKR